MYNISQSNIGYKTFASQFIAQNAHSPKKQQIILSIKNNKVKLLHALLIEYQPQTDINQSSLMKQENKKTQSSFLHYAAYYNSPDCALYLLFRYASFKQHDINNINNKSNKNNKNPSASKKFSNQAESQALQNNLQQSLDKDNKTPIQLCAYTGHLETLKSISQYWKIKNINFLNVKFIQILMSNGFKRTDSKNGSLKIEVSHQRQKKFIELQQKILMIYQQYHQKYRQFILRAYSHQDSLFNRNGFHYVALNRYQKCSKTLEYILTSLQLEKTNIQIDDKLLMAYDQISQLLQNDKNITKNAFIDPRTLEDTLQLVKDFILPQKLKQFEKQQKKIISQTLLHKILNMKDKDNHIPIYIASKTGSSHIVALLKKTQQQCMKQQKRHLNNKQIDKSSSQGLLTSQTTEIIKVSLNNTSRLQMIDLCQASKQSNIEVMNFLINCGEQINKKKTIFGTFALLQAIKSFHKQKNLEPIKVLLKSGADINEQDSNGWTIFHHIAEHGHIGILKQIFNQRQMKSISPIKINTTTNKGYHILHIASMNNHNEIIEYLLTKQITEKFSIEQNPININTGQNILHYASKRGSLKVLKTILQLKGQKLIYLTDMNDNTALHLASSHSNLYINISLDHAQCIKELVYYDSDYDKLLKMRNKKGKLPQDLNLKKQLFWNVFTAAREGNVNLIRNLYNQQKSIIDKVTYVNKRTPLILSIIEKKLVNVKFLVQCGADQYHQDLYGKTASQYAEQLEIQVKKNKGKIHNNNINSNSNSNLLPLIKKIRSLLD